MDNDNIVDTLAAGYTEDQLRAALERVKTVEGEKRAAKFKATSKFLVCKCGERAQYISLPVDVKYSARSIKWIDERNVIELDHMYDPRRVLGDNASAPGDDEGASPSIGDFIAFAWCGKDACDWFSIGSEHDYFRKLDALRGFFG